MQPFCPQIPRGNLGDLLNFLLVIALTVNAALQIVNNVASRKAALT